MKKLHKHWKRWPYKHTTLLIIAIVLFVAFVDSAIMAAFFEFNTELGYVGAFIAGILFVSLFTASPAVVILFELGQQHNIWWVTLWAALGTVVGDFLILRLFEDKFLKELTLITRKLGGKKLLRRVRSKRFRPLEVISGLVIVASPFPDELGLAILDVSHLGKVRILMLCFVANALGILAIVSTAHFLT